MNKKVQVWLPVLFSLTLCVGMYFGYNMRDNMPGKNFFSIQKSNPLQEIFDLIQNKYVDDVDLKQLSDTAINTILSKLDPHSIYIPKEELAGANEDIAGQFYGIGIEFSIINDTVNVVNVLPDAPGFIAGLKIGDKLLKVGDSVISGNKTSSDKVKKILRGDLNTNIVISVQRNNQIIKVNVTRGIIPLTSIDASYMINKEIGYIKLNKFSESTYREFMQSMEKLQQQGLKKLILDLRGNGGGIVDQATEIADEFLDGDKMITYTEGKRSPKKEYRCKRPGLFEQGELTVLCDEGTASASEILIGALQDWDRATIIGRRTFGKGLVQEQYDLSDGSALRLTIARYYTPIGRSIQRPYTKGDKAYYDEIYDRYKDGEVLNADSIKNDTTKIFKTAHGKTVYGGGGITPDVFVGIDTTEYSSAFSKAYIKGTFADFAYHFYLQSQSRLAEFKTLPMFVNGFQITDNDWNNFKSFAIKDSISFNNISEKEKQLLNTRIKSYIAREVWRNEGYFETLNATDSTIKKATHILSK